MTRTILWSGLSALLTIAAFYVPHAWPLIFVALIPFLHAISVSTSWRAALLGAVVFAFPFMGSVIIWFFALPSYESYSESALVSSSVVFFGWLLIVIGNTLPIVLFAGFGRILRALRSVDIVALSVLWVFCEYLRLHAFNIITAGPGVEHPPFFSVGFLGYPLADSDSWLQFGALGGVWLLSFIVIATNLVLYRIFKMKNRAMRTRAAGIALAVLVLGSLAPIASWREAQDLGFSRTVKVGYMSIYPSWKPGYKLEDSYAELIASNVTALQESGADLIILPEGARYFTDDYQWIQKLPSGGTVVIDSGSGETDAGQVVVSVAGNAGTGEVVPIRGKEMVTPQGEYTIALYTTLMRLLGNEGLANYLEEQNYSTAGAAYSARALDASPVRASVLFCIEILAPSFAKTLVATQDSNFLAIVLSHGSFSYSPTLIVDTNRFLRMRVVEAGVPAVVATEFTPAYAFDRFGRVLEVLGTNRQDEMSVIELKVSGRADVP